MSNKFRNKHAYGAVVGGLNFETKRDHRNIADQLNFIKDNLDKFMKRSINRLVDEDTTELNQKNALQAAAARWFVKWLYGTFRVNTVIKTLESNPNGNRDGESLYKEYLNNDCKISEFDPKLYDQERLKIFDVAIEDGEVVGGLSFWRLFQHAYSLLKAIQSDLGDKAIHVSHPEKITEEYVVKIAKKMHKDKQSVTEQTEQNQPVVEEINGEFVEAQTSAEDILEYLQNGGSASELENVEKIQQVRELASGGTKGALTRRLNTLQA